MNHRTVLACLIACTAVINSAAAQPTSESPGAVSTEQVAEQIVDRTNTFRQDNGLEPVAANAQLSAAAQDFAEFMASTGKYGHQADGRTPAERARSAGYDYCMMRENIAYRTNTGTVTEDSLGTAMMQGWIDSPSHRDNLLADHATDIGVGVATENGRTFYAVQMLGRPASQAIRLRVTNTTGSVRTIVLESEGDREQVDLQPRMILTAQRCYPTTISLPRGDSSLRLDSDAEIRVTDDGLERVSD